MPGIIIAVAAAIGSVSVPASGPDEYRTPFVNEIGLENVLAGDYPHRLRPRDVIFPLVMYLQLRGTFGEDHRELFRRFQTKPSGDFREMSTWQASRHFWEALRPHFQRPESFSTYRYTVQVTIAESEDGEHRTRTSELVYNCPKDAFLTAVETLQLRRARYGPSVELSRWIEAQIKVFTQCSGEVAFDPPAEPQPDWQPLEQHDRRYQIAAAYFYAGRYLEAADRFTEIGRTPDSPWRDLGRYLVPRCLAREAIVNGNERARHLDMAINAYRELERDPEFLASFPSIPGLIRHYEVRRNPTALTRDLERRIFEHPASVTVQDLDDYRYLINQARLPPGTPRIPGEGATDYELWSWLATSHSNPSMAVERWREAGTLPWLYVAMATANVDLGAATLDGLVEAADGLSADAPGYLNMLVERIRILGLLDRVDEGMRLAEDALGTVPDRSWSNRIRLAVASIATNWADFLDWVSLKALVLPWSDDAVRRLPSNVSRITSDTALFPAEATNVLDSYFTPTIFLETIDSPGLSEYQRGRMAIAGWTKAMLAGDLDSAVELAGRVRRHVPYLNRDFEGFEQAEDKYFEAARIIFDYPGISPWMWEGAGRVIWAGPDTRPAPDHVMPYTGAGWWCAGWHEHFTEEPMLRHPRFGDHAIEAGYSDRDVAAMQIMRRDIQKTAATTSFGPHVIRYAKSNRDDPRIPRTLHRLVFATRYACGPAPGEISRAAFKLLHENFPNTEWAAKTPYWYDGH